MTTANHALETDKDKASTHVDIFYSLVNLGSTTMWSVVSGWLLYFYLPPEGEGSALVPAALYGATMLAVRALNALIAPAVGHLSDQSQNPWGRRLPLMFGSALPMVAFFFLLWTPPLEEASIWNLAYLAVVFLLYNVAYTFNQVPYMALLPELAIADKHRVRISAWSSGFFLLGMIVGGAAGPLIDRLGFRSTALVYACVTLPMLYLPFLVLRERPERRTQPEKRLTLRDAAAAMLRNRAFLIMTATGILYWSVTTFVQSIVPFLVTEVCQLTKAETFSFYIPGILASLACYPVVTWLSDRLGKSTVFSGSLLASAVALPGLMVIGSWIPLPLKAQGMLWITLQAVAMAGVTMLPPAFGAEITDHDQELTGQRREGAYYATWGLLDQAINGVASALLPLLLLLGRSQSDPRGPLGVRLVGPLGGTMMLAAFLIFQKYPFRHSSPGRGDDNGSDAR
ncbi:MAG: MFS transporter [Anaerolineae bacterium]|jgi:GPH family glycoside/pentoside/hexuronide:cation symporter